ncbi:MAG: PilZ domain-containing protein [Nitrospirae bacterium]|nr:PilZ domain-containing protein [Nitrospirota bacterium]
MFNINEKRKYPRVTINANITYSRSGGNGQYSGFCKNLSHTGILFETDQAFTPGDTAIFTLDTKSHGFRPLTARIEVVRVEPSENSFAVAGRIMEYQ